MFFRFFDRTPLSRDRDCFGLTEIAKFKDLACHKDLTILKHGGRYKQPVQAAGTSSQYITGESPPIKAGHWGTIPHLESTCTRFNTSARRRMRPSAGPERSQQLQAILQQVRLLFLLRQHFCRRQRFWMHQGFRICQRFWMRQGFSIRQRFWMRQGFGICQRFWRPQGFGIRQRCEGIKVLASAKDFESANVFVSTEFFEGANVFVSAEFLDAPMFLYIFCGAYIFVYFSAFLFSMRQ